MESPQKTPWHILGYNLLAFVCYMGIGLGSGILGKADILLTLAGMSAVIHIGFALLMGIIMLFSAKTRNQAGMWLLAALIPPLIGFSVCSMMFKF